MVEQCLAWPPQQQFEAVWTLLAFEGRPQGSLGAPRFIQGGLDSETYNFSGLGFVVILIGIGGADKAPFERSENGGFFLM